MLQELLYSLLLGFIYDVYVVLYYDIYEWLIPMVIILFQEYIIGLISLYNGLMYHNPYGLMVYSMANTNGLLTN